MVEDDPASPYFLGLQERARRIARSDTEVDFVGMPPGTYGGKTPADVVVYPYLMSLHHHSILDNAYAAQQRGYDVFVLGSVQDPAIEEARSLLSIPVVGYGESAMLVACMLGRKFAVVVFQHGMDQIMDMRIEKLGLGSRAISTRPLGLTFDDVTESVNNSEQIVERFRLAAQDAIRRGAEAIIPGQLYLSEAVARAGISRIDEVPVVDALSVTIKAAEMINGLRVLGITGSRHGVTNAMPSEEMIEHARLLHSAGRVAVSDKPVRCERAQFRGRALQGCL